MSNQLKTCIYATNYYVITIKIPLIEEEKLIPLTQCNLLVEHNLISSCRNSFFVVEPKHFFQCLKIGTNGNLATLPLPIYTEWALYLLI